MEPLEAVLLVAAIGLPLHLLVVWQLDRLCDPDYLRSVGVVVLREEVLQDRSAEIGRYEDEPIWGTVTFMGMLYRFDRIVPRAYRWSVGECELFLEPGLVYVTD